MQRDYKPKQLSEAGMQRKRTAQDRLLQILHPNRQGAKKEEGHPAPTVMQGGALGAGGLRKSKVPARGRNR